MYKILQINITANWGSHGKIAEGIGQLVRQQGWESHIAYGRWMNESQSILYHIGSNIDEAFHLISSRLIDNQGLMSVRATKRLCRYIDSIQPDIIHLHNIHGYYLNYPLLFQSFSNNDIPVVWTLHDCWPFTGHCAHYMFAKCDKWKKECNHCPLTSNYPKSWFLDRSQRNFLKKKQIFTSLSNLTLVPVSSWIQNELKSSFLQEIPNKMIHNGIDLSIFQRKRNTGIKTLLNIPIDNYIILGVASNWNRKGLEDFISLRKLLPLKYTIILVGINKKRISHLPTGIIGIERTDCVSILVDLYSSANVFFNPTWEDNFPTTILEAMACGTPVVTYDTGGCKEGITPLTGHIISKGNLNHATQYIKDICTKGKNYYTQNCRTHITEHFNKYNKFREYIDLYKDILDNKKKINEK